MDGWVIKQAITGLGQCVERRQPTKRVEWCEKIVHLVGVFAQTVELPFPCAPDRVGVALDGVGVGLGFVFDSKCAIGYTKYK